GGRPANRILYGSEGAHLRTSSEKSSPPAEWVSAPRDTKSTPVWAPADRLSRLTPPLASSRAAPLVRLTAACKSATEKLSSRMSDEPALNASSSSERFVTSTSTR